MTHSVFHQKYYQGRFTSALRWHQLDDLWAKVKSSPKGWYAYFINETLPNEPLDTAALDHFIAEVDELLHRDHYHDYCGIVYADSLDKPAMIKIYDPNNSSNHALSSGKKPEFF